MSEVTSPKAPLDLFLWWAQEFEKADQFYATGPDRPGSVVPADYDWTPASDAADRLLAHAPTTAAEAICLIEVLIDQLGDHVAMTAALRALQVYVGQQVLGDRFARAPDRAVIDYVSRSA